MTGQAGVAGRARTEAERRWPSTVPPAPSSAPLVLAWHDAGMASGFVLGAQWGYDTYRADHGAAGTGRVADAVAPSGTLPDRLRAAEHDGGAGTALLLEAAEAIERLTDAYKTLASACHRLHGPGDAQRARADRAEERLAAVQAALDGSVS